MAGRTERPRIGTRYARPRTQSIGRKYASGVRLVAVAAAIALSAAAPASAAMWPPPAPQALHAVKLSQSHARLSARTCTARAKVARWLAPVACEQPPRSQLLLAQALYGA